MKNRLMLLCVFLAACPPPLPPDPPEPTPDPEGEYTCQTACENQDGLGCELAQPTAEGATCEDVCSNTMDGPEVAQWDVACLTAATVCNHCE